MRLSYQHLHRKITIVDRIVDACAQGIDVPNAVSDDAVAHNFKYLRTKAFAKAMNPRANDDKLLSLKSSAVSSPCLMKISRVIGVVPAAFHLAGSAAEPLDPEGVLRRHPRRTVYPELLRAGAFCH